MIPDRMRVPRFLGNGEIDFVEKSVPQPGPGQLLVRVRANALCGSERGQFYRGSPNTTPGHEAAGVVALAGPNTRTLVGTPGVVYLMDFCQTGKFRRRGWTNLCEAKRGDMGFNHDGGYGSYELVHENIFFPIDADLPFDEATLLLDVMGTGGHAIEYARRLCARPSELETLLIVGAGPIGLAVLAMARLLLGPNAQIFISDIVPYRLNLAEQLGGIPINAARNDTAQDRLREAGLSFIDAAIDTSGNAAARQSVLALLGRRSPLVCVGHGSDLSLNVSRDLIGRENLVAGSEYFRFDELAVNLARLREPETRAFLRPLLTHRFPVVEIKQAFATFWAGDTGKVIIVQSDSPTLES